MTSVLRLLAAALIGAAASAATVAAPAYAAACPAGTGVTVVVNSSVRCDADGGGTAAANVSDAGHTLTYAAQSPGFVCRVDGAPADDPCLKASPADAYWALFWSDGKSGSWVYSSLGVTSLKVPDGGAIAFVFQTSTTRTSPSVPAPRPAPAQPEPTAEQSSPPAKKKPTPTPKPAPKATPATPSPPTAAPSPQPTASAASSEPTVEPTSEPTVEPAAEPTTGASSAAAAPVAEETLVATSAEADQGGPGVPAIAASAVLLLVLGGAGLVAWRRRQGS